MEGVREAIGVRDGEAKGKVRTVRREEGVERGAQDQVRWVRATEAVCSSPPVS
jgi:hypothetical protein